MTELFRLSACALVDRLRAGEITPEDAIDAAEARAAAVDPAVNALPTPCFDRARERAKARRPADGERSLAGLPLAVKDLTDVAGVRTTYGSPIFADHVPAASDPLVERLEANGGLVVAKSNTPEFGAGANTFNEVFGATVNPWDTRLSCAGSSGGSAVALATGMVWLATGSDLGGSLRNPASFCSIVGLRPSPGRVARSPRGLAFDDLSVDGPMGRTVADVGLMLDAMVGLTAADPLSLPAPVESFRAAAERPAVPRRVAFSPDLGITPVDPEVAAVTRAAARRFADLGAEVVEASPDFSGAHEVFQTMRALSFAAGKRELLATRRDALKPEVIWNIEKGLALTADEVTRAMAERSRLYRAFAAFMAEYDVLLTPATIVPPYPVEQRYVEAVAGHAFETYIDWLAIAYAVTLTSAPAISVPCGFTASGLPVGLQIVGRVKGEADLLATAAAFEGAAGVAGKVPTDPREVARPESA